MPFVSALQQSSMHGSRRYENKLHLKPCTYITYVDLSAGRAYICASYVAYTSRHGAVCTAPATVAIAVTLQAVSLAAAVVEIPQTRQEARVVAHEVCVWALIDVCISGAVSGNFALTQGTVSSSTGFMYLSFVCYSALFNAVGAGHGCGGRNTPPGRNSISQRP